MADKDDEAPDAGWTGEAAPTASAQAAATASAPTASAPPAAADRPSRVRRLLVPGIALVAGLAIGLGGGALLGSALDGPRGFDRAAFVGNSDGDRPGGPGEGLRDIGPGHRDGLRHERRDSDDPGDGATDDETD
ncbi:hypothetical protein ABIB15_002423 [Marisediminicola sp. UYEF4]|uniref:hypothetical protein n=1 Tax=Marisediminicola sp. UYEF4 TaxID=1756384 RepID=UPI00339A8954